MCSAFCQSDMTLKIRTVINVIGQSPNVENPSTLHKTYYRHGTMRKKESSDIVDIANCDTRTGFIIDMNSHEYRAYNVVRFWNESQYREYLEKNPQSAVRIESHTVDTGEQKMFFGHPAKHLITTIRRSQDSKSEGGEETVDGWYIEHERPNHSCIPDPVAGEPYYALGTTLVEYPSIPEFHHTGPLPTGLGVLITRTLKPTNSGKGHLKPFTGEEVVEELSDSPLSPSIFEVPAGFHNNPNLFGRQISKP